MNCALRERRTADGLLIVVDDQKSPHLLASLSEREHQRRRLLFEVAPDGFPEVVGHPFRSDFFCLGVFEPGEAERHVIEMPRTDFSRSRARS